MLLALYDYIRYKKRWGRYSHGSMLAAKWRIASPSEFPGYENYAPGSLMFASTTDSFVSWLVMYFTDSVTSHVAMFAGDGIIHDMTTSGTLNHPFSDYLDGKSYLKVFEPPPPLAEKPDEVRTRLLSKPWVPYGWHKVVRMFIDFITARRRDEFRWRYYIDLSIVILFPGCILLPVSTVPLLGVTVVWALYTVEVLFNLMRRRRHGGCY